MTMDPYEAILADQDRQRFLLAMLNVMAKTDADGVPLDAVVEGLESPDSATDVKRVADELLRTKALAKKGESLSFCSDEGFVQLASRLTIVESEQLTATVLAWLIQRANAFDERAAQAVTRVVVLLQPAWRTAHRTVLAELGKVCDGDILSACAETLGSFASRDARAMELIRELALSIPSDSRALAARALVHVTGYEEDTHVLAERLLKDPDDRVWWEAAAAMGRLAGQSTSAANLVWTFCRDDSPYFRARAARALAALADSDREAQSAFLRLLSDSFLVVRGAAARALAEFAVAHREEAVTYACQMYRDTDEAVRAFAAEAMTETLARQLHGAPDAVLSLVRDPRSFLRRCAAEALGRVVRSRPSRVLRVVSQLAQSRDEAVRCGIGRALARVGPIHPTEAVRMLTHLSRDEEPSVRGAAASSLGVVARILGGQTLDLLAELGRDRSRYVRSEAVGALAVAAPADPERGLAFFCQLAKDKSRLVRTAAAESVAQAARAAREEALSSCAELAADPSPRVRAELARSLASLASEGSEQALTMLLQLCRDDDAHVRTSALSQVATVPVEKVDRVLRVAVQSAADPEASVRAAASAALEASLCTKPDLTLRCIALLLEQGTPPDTLFSLSRVARDPRVAAAATAWHQLVLHEDVPVALEAAQPYLDAARELEGGEEIAITYEVLKAFAPLQTLNALAAGASLSDELESLEDPVRPAIVEALRDLRRACAALSKFQSSDSLGDQVSYLTQAAMLVDSAGAKEQQLVQPERRILSYIVARWRNIVHGELQVLRGHAELKAELKAKSVRANEPTTIVLELTNHGRSVAENVRVQLTPAPEFRVGRPPGPVPRVGLDRPTVVEFELVPLTDQPFRLSFDITYDDSDGADKKMSFADLVRPTAAARPAVFKPIPNPYVPGMPLRADSPIFFGREDVFEFIRENLRGSLQQNVLLLVGQRRTGKTSVLRRLAGYLGEDVVVYVDCQGLLVSGVADFLHRLATKISSELRRSEFSVQTPPRAEFEQSPDTTFEDVFMAEVRAALGERLMVLVFDEFEELEAKVQRGSLTPELFGYLRHLMQHSDGIAFILAGTHTLEELTADYWSFLFNTALYNRVGFLSEAAARRLINEPVAGSVEYDHLAQEKLMTLTAGHPYFLQLCCWLVVQYAIREKVTYVTLNHVNEVLDSVLERGEDNLSYLWHLATGPERVVLSALAVVLRNAGVASASDVAAALREHNVTWSPADVSKMLYSLVKKDLLVDQAEPSPRFEFRIKLFQAWIAKIKAVAKVIEETEVSRG